MMMMIKTRDTQREREKKCRDKAHENKTHRMVTILRTQQRKLK